MGLVSPFEWRDAYGLSLAPVDAEHRGFFTRLALLDSLARSGAEPSELRARLHGLAAYARSHFLHEEEFLAGVGCPEVEAQRTEHAVYLEHLTGLALVEDPRSADSLRFARDWMVDHILGSDRCYGRWLHAALDDAELARRIRSYGASRA